ncbi:MAG: VWA domain-containing protein, partial [Sedimenticola sp.]|nr:VWA domain-containing protein [Sedimenticola sp.]
TAEVGDFTANSGTLTFAAGVTSQTFTVQTTQDNVDESDETFTVTLSNATNGGQIIDGTAVATILDDDDTPSITTPAALSVSEEGLANGLIDTTGDPSDTTDSASAVGTISFTDQDSTAFTISLNGPVSVTSNGSPISLTSNGVAVDDWSWDAATQTLTGQTSAGTDVLTITLGSVSSGGGNHSVNYTVNLLAPVDHPINNTEDIMDLQFGAVVSDGAQSDSTNFTVRIEDDRPISGDLVNALEVPLAKSNIMLILDFSGSMRGQELVDMKAAVNAMLDSYDNAGYAAVQIVTFSASAAIPSDGGWISVADAKAYISALTDADMSGSTNYDAALATAQTAFAETNGKITGGKNISYFLSDGAPTSGDGTIGIDATEEGEWETFVDNNDIDSYAVGFAGANVTALEPIAYNGIASPAEERPAIDATATGTNLTDVLLQTVATTVPGSLFGSLATGGFGADGNGHVRTVTIDSVTYTYDANAGTITNTANATVINGTSFSVTTVLKGEITINMETGAYSYVADPTFTTAFAEVLGFTMQDVDGDVTSGTVTVNVTRAAKPVPTLNANTDEVYEAAMATGTNSASDGEVATGNILSDDTIPNGITLSSVSIAGGTTDTSVPGQITVTTAEGNTLVVDTNTGAYTYTLLNAVDHQSNVTLVSETFDSNTNGWTNASVLNSAMLIERDETVTKTFTGLGNPGDNVTITFDMNIVGGWENSGGATDYFR